MTPPSAVSPAHPPSRLLTLANGISVARLVAAPFSLAAVLDGEWLLAAVLFVGAVASDFLDGWVARQSVATSRP